MTGLALTQNGFILHTTQRIMMLITSGVKLVWQRITLFLMKITSGILVRVLLVQIPKSSTTVVKNLTIWLTTILKIIRVAKTNGTLKFGTSCSVNLTTLLKTPMNHFHIRTLIPGWDLNGLFQFLKTRQLTLKLTSLCH